MAFLIAKKSRFKWLYVLLSAWVFVPGCNFVRGSAQYFAGTASLQGVGQFHRYVDRETRLRTAGAGCIFIGFEPFVFPPYNAAVRLWTHAFGYQKGAYTGPYPTQEEAEAMMRDADTITVERTGGHFLFRQGGQSAKVDSTLLYSFRYNPQSMDRVTGKFLGHGCFVFKTIHYDEDHRRAIYLLDTEKEQLLDEYVVMGE